MWLVLLAAGLATRTATVQGQPTIFESEDSEEEDEDTRDADGDRDPTARGDEDDDDGDDSDDEDGRPAGFSEPDEVIDARLAALPVAGAARLLSVQVAIADQLRRGSTGVFVANIHGEIELGIAYYVERAIQEAERSNAALLVFDIETPGGRVDAAVLMRDVILDSEVPTVAFVNRRAWSAGALIAMANDLIVVAEGASIGAATPITIGGGGEAQAVGEKVVSALRGEFRATAEATGRNGAIAESMVDAELEVGGVIESGKLLTLTGREALGVGMAESRARNLDALLSLLDLSDQQVSTISESWAESLVRVLTSPIVSSLLMSLGLLGIFFELMSPGFGWAGAMGIAMLLLFFAGHLLVHLAGLEEVLIFIAGVVLLGLEIFVIPGFGIAGVLGLLAIGASMVLALVAADVNFAISTGAMQGALIRVLISLAGTVIAAILLFKYVPRTAVGRRLVLQAALPAGTALPESAVDALGPGQTGIALTGLRPYGKARFGDHRAEVVSEGAYVEKGSQIRIVRVSGSRIEVRHIPSLEPDQTAGDSLDPDKSSPG